jgi:protoheme ferro-lyase
MDEQNGANSIAEEWFLSAEVDNKLLFEMHSLPSSYASNRNWWYNIQHTILTKGQLYAPIYRY